MNCHNVAERAMRTFKNHLIVGLCTCNTCFPAQERDRILQQADLTLNHLGSSRRNTTLSSYAAVFGNFNFSSTPLAPPGAKALIHLKPGQQTTFGVHGIDGYYIGPSINHYQYYKYYIPETGSIRDADTSSSPSHY